MQSMGDELALVAPANAVDKAVSSFVLHQSPMGMKQPIIGAMFNVLRPGGRLFIADNGEQRPS